MALFELDGGRLLPAQFGRTIPGGVTPQVLQAVRAQVLEIVARPLFPVMWTAGDTTEESFEPRLTALDASGQVVAVEVASELTSGLLINALARLSDTATMSWAELAGSYPGGIEGFKAGWAQFREEMPPSVPGGPRLILVVADVAHDVRPALSVLFASGVEVHELSLRELADGRSFISVSVVSPRVYGQRANALLGEAGPVPELPTGGLPAAGADLAASEPVELPPAGEAPADSQSNEGQSSTEQPDHETKPVPRVGTRAGAHRAKRAAAPVGLESIPAEASSELLALVGTVLGELTPLALAPPLQTPDGAAVTPTGVIVVPQGEFTDPTAALVAAGIPVEHVANQMAAELGAAPEDDQIGWHTWRIAHQYGPTLYEAVSELRL